MKKTLAIVLVMFMLAAVSVAALADGTVYTEGTMYYTVGDGTITIVGCFGKNESITVPNSIGGIPVNTIASGAFAGNKYLKTVYLPDTITSVEGGAFGGGVAVVYNYNVTEPVATPPATEGEEEIEIVPSVEVTPQPVEEQPVITGSGTSELEDEPSGDTGYTQNAGITYGSGEADLDDETGSGPEENDDFDGTVVLEGDVDLDAEEEAKAAVASTPEPVKTPEPVQTAVPSAEPTEKPVAKTAGKTEPEKVGGSIPLLTILLLAAWIIVLVTIVILLRVNAKRKAQMRRAARARARARRSEDSDTD